MNTDKLVNLNAVQETDDLINVMRLCVGIEKATSQIKDMQDSCFGNLRRVVVECWTAALEKAGGDKEQVNLTAIRGAFNARLIPAEAWLRSPDCPNNYKEGYLPGTWKTAKSQLGSAIENGFDFMSSPQISSGKIKAFNKAEDDKKQKSKEQAALKAAREAGMLPHAVDNPQAPAKPELPTGAQTAEQVGGMDAPFAHDKLSKEQYERAVDLMNRLNTIASNDGAKVDSLLKALDDQSVKAFGRAMDALAKAQRTGTNG